MSYILEALKKSDQQRQRGATPKLPVAQFTVSPPTQRVYYGLFAAVLLCIGIAIGWLHPWQAEQPAPANGHVQMPAQIIKPAMSPVPLSDLPPQQAAPLSLAGPPEVTRKKIQELPVPDVTPAASPAVDRIKPDISLSAKTGTQREVSPPLMAETLMPGKPVKPAGATQEQKVIPLDELPVAIQQEIPPMTIQLHAYSSKPVERLVSINSRMLREGGSLSPELKLEQITPDGMIFSYKGYLFQRGIR